MTGPESITEREHPIGLFDELVCRGAGTLHLVSGANPRVVVLGPEALVNRVAVRYRGSRLVVAFRVGPDPVGMLGFRPDSIRAIVHTDAVSRVALQGVTNMVLGDGPENPFVADAVKIVSSGTGRVTGDISAGEVDLRLRGLGGAELSGDVENLTAKMPGMGGLDCMGLVCKYADVTVSSIGTARLMVLDELRATVNSTGRVIYRGTAVVNAGGGSRTRIEHVE